MENVAVINKSDLKFLLKIYRQLFLQYLELTNINLAFAQQIRQFRELLLNFRDTVDLVSLKDTKMRDAMNYLEHLEKHETRLAARSESLQLRQQNLVYHLLAIFDEHEIVQPKLMQLLQLPHATDKQVAELLPYVAPIEAIKKTQTGFLLHQVNFLREDYLLTKREGTELQYILSMGTNVHLYVVNQVVLLSQIGQVLSRELAQLIMHWRQLVDLADELAIEYAKEDKLNKQLQDYLQKQTEMQQQSQFLLRPTLTPFSRHKSNQGNEGE